MSRRSPRLQQQIAVFVRGAGADASVSDRARCREGAVPRRPGYLFGSCEVPQATGITRSQGRPKKSALWVAAFIEKRGRADRPTGNAGQPDGGGGNEIVSGCNEVFSSKVLVDHRIVSGCVRVGCRHLARAVDRLISKSNHKALSLG